MPSDPTCVHRAADLGEADIVAAWLAEQGITPLVKDYAAVSLYGLVVSSPRGVEVCVVDEEQRKRATDLLREHVAEIAARKSAEATGPPIPILCKACGRTTSFPHGQRGSVQSCPYCRAYMDVPDLARPADMVDSP